MASPAAGAPSATISLSCSPIPLPCARQKSGCIPTRLTWWARSPESLCSWTRRTGAVLAPEQLQHSLQVRIVKLALDLAHAGGNQVAIGGQAGPGFENAPDVFFQAGQVTLLVVLLLLQIV